MPLELQDVYFSDGDSIQNVYISAFINDRFNQTLYPGMTFDQLIAGSKSRWPRNYGNLSAYYRKVVDTDTGEVVSYSKWAFENTTARGQLQKPTGKFGKSDSRTLYSNDTCVNVKDCLSTLFSHRRLHPRD